MGVYKRSEFPVEGVGVCVVKTVDFPPYDLDIDYEYCGFETQLFLPDGTATYGNGPEEIGETPEECHAGMATPERVAELVRDWFAQEDRS